MRVFIETLGCPRNDVESDFISGLLSQKGYDVVSNPVESEIIIVNTCGFIEPAKQESIDTILELSQYKQNQCRLLLVVGCLAQRYPQAVLKELPEVDGVVGIEDLKRLDELILKATRGERLCMVTTPNGRLPETRPRQVPTLPYAYLQIADGCNHSCAFCALPLIRGRYRSRLIESLISEGRFLAAYGVKEIVLVAQDIGRYGTDLYNERCLPALISALAEIDGLDWIRLLYLEPQSLKSELLEAMKENPKTCPYLNIPLQHASDKVLKRMNRWGNRKKYLDMITRIRKAVPEITLRTNFIVGFPGESEKDFEQLLTFIQEVGFDYAGVFEFSAEENTDAFNLPDQVSKEVRRERYHQLIEMQDQIGWKKNQSCVGKTLDALIEKNESDGFKHQGRIAKQAPEIDGELLITKGHTKVGEFTKVKITQSEQYDLIGELDV